MTRFYATARQAVMRDRNWPFLTRFKAPALVEENPTDEWDYSYRYPTDCLRVRRILGTDGRNSPNRIPYRIARDDNGRLIYTDQPEAVIEYTVDLNDSSQFPPDFVLALSLRLAAYAAPSLTRGDENQLGKRAYEFYVAEFGLAASNSFNEEQDDRSSDSEFIRERGD